MKDKDSATWLSDRFLSPTHDWNSFITPVENQRGHFLNPFEARIHDAWQDVLPLRAKPLRSA